MHNQKPTNLKSKLISKHQTNLKKISFPILQHRVGPMLSSSVFQNTNTHLLKIFCSNISVLPLSGKYCNFVQMLCTFQRQCSNVQPHVVDNTQTFRFYLDFSLIYQQKKKKNSHAALICFHNFGISLVQSKHKNIKTTLCSVMLSSWYATLN